MTHSNYLNQIADSAFFKGGLSQEEALDLINLENQEEIFLLLAQANLLRQRTRGGQVELCAIVNARSGLCSEDCAFCAQSAHNRASIEAYPLMDTARIMDAAFAAKDHGVTRFSIVASGRAATAGPELELIARTIEKVAESGLSPCASLGLLDDESAGVLREAGLRTYHHNLETAPSFFPQICTTHSFDDRVATAKRSKEYGFRLCSGGIFGLGESREERVEMAMSLKEIEPDSVPLNFLNPIPGTPLAETLPLSPLEILKTIAVYRLILPQTDIRTCGGRERNLRGLQPLMFLAGANATMVGNYLTTSGRSPSEDIQDILDLGLTLQESVDKDRP